MSLIPFSRLPLWASFLDGLVRLREASGISERKRERERERGAVVGSWTTLAVVRAVLRAVVRAAIRAQCCEYVSGETGQHLAHGILETAGARTSRAKRAMTHRAQHLGAKSCDSASSETREPHCGLWEPRCARMSQAKQVGTPPARHPSRPSRTSAGNMKAPRGLPVAWRGVARRPQEPPVTGGYRWPGVPCYRCRPPLLTRGGGRRPQQRPPGHR